MDIKFLKRSFFQRLLGISATTKPGIDGSWNYADGKLTIDLGKALELKTSSDHSLSCEKRAGKSNRINNRMTF